MAVDFNTVFYQKCIDFDSVATLRNQVFTLVMNVNLNSVAGGYLYSLWEKTSPYDSFRYSIYFSASKLNIFNPKNGGAGGWKTTSNIPTGAFTQLVLAADLTNNSNDPIFYINGVVDTTVETATPTGTQYTGTDTACIIGGPNEGVGNSADSFDGKIYSFCAYNRILSAAEILDAYNSKKAIPSYNGLVFAPALWSRGEVGDGGVLTASHTIIDQVTGAVGQPSGSPLHRMDSTLSFED